MIRLSALFKHVTVAAVIVGAGLGLSAACKAQGITVNIDGRTVDFSNNPPFQQNGSVLVPLRGVFEQLGAGVNYNASTRTIEATQGQTDVILRLGQDTAYINGQPQPLLQPPLVNDGVTYVPLRFVAQSFGANVNWVAATQTVEIQTAGGDQNAQDNGPSSDNGGAPLQPVDATNSDQDTGNGPVRLASISDIEGDVSWRPSADSDWSPADFNIPLREGAQIWAGGDGRAEIQFDDGSWLRLANDAVATLQTMNSGSDGEYTEITLNQGVALLHLRTPESVYQVDTSLLSVKSAGPSKIRIDSESGVDVAVRQGSADIFGNNGSARLQAGSALHLDDAGSEYNIGGLPGPDSYDSWSDNRDSMSDHPDSNLPPNIGLVAGNLDSYGDWHQDPQYGRVWQPRESDPNWRPYADGNWVWVNPFGWTWVANEQWGWAPYHYGTWVQNSYGWCWVPGPRQQYWSPAVVHFSSYQGNMCWAPLAPSEVQYPPQVHVGLRLGNWSLNFAVGGCAVYYPQDSHSCAPRAWNNQQINHVTNTYNDATINNITKNTYVNNVVFVPKNAVNGATAAPLQTFGHGATHTRLRPLATPASFIHGEGVGAPAAGLPPSGGPPDAIPNKESFTPSHAFVPVPASIAAVVARPVFKAPRHAAVVPAVVVPRAPGSVRPRVVPPIANTVPPVATVPRHVPSPSQLVRPNATQPTHLTPPVVVRPTTRPVPPIVTQPLITPVPRPASPIVPQPLIAPVRRPAPRVYPQPGYVAPVRPAPPIVVRPRPLPVPPPVVTVPRPYMPPVRQIVPPVVHQPVPPPVAPPAPVVAPKSPKVVKPKVKPLPKPAPPPPANVSQ